MYNILITDGLDKECIKELKELGFNVVEEFYEKDKLGKALENFDIVIIRSATKIKKDIIDEAVKGDRLKLIIRGGVGVDNIDVEYATKHGIQVLNTPNASSISVAELTIGHIFAVSRFINISNVDMREGKWEKKKYKGTEINGKTLGLIGFGRIAKEVAKMAEGLGMKIIYNDVLGKVTTHDRYTFETIDNILEKSDFLSLHIPYDPDKGPMISEKELKIMKNTAYLINCARGGVVNEEALLSALNNNEIAGCAIDVFEEEPTLNIELVNHEKASVTPHIGASTKEAQKRVGIEVVNIVKEFCKVKNVI